MKNIIFYILAITLFGSQKMYCQVNTTQNNNFEYLKEKLSYTTFYKIAVILKPENYSLHKEDEGLSKPNVTNNGLVQVTSHTEEKTELITMGQIALWGIEKSIDNETGIIYYFRNDSTEVTSVFYPYTTMAKYKQLANGTSTWQEHIGTTNTIAEQKNEKKRYTCSESNIVSGKGIDTTARDAEYYGLPSFSPKVRFNPKNSRAEISDWFVPVQINKMDSLCIRSFIKGGDKEKCAQSSSTSNATEEVKSKIEALVNVVNTWTTLSNSEQPILDNEMRMPPYKAAADYNNIGEFLAQVVPSSDILYFRNTSNDYCNAEIERQFSKKVVKTNQINQDAYWQNVYEDDKVSISIFLRITIAPLTYSEARDKYKEFVINGMDYEANKQIENDNPFYSEEGVESLPIWIMNGFKH